MFIIHCYLNQPCRRASAGPIHPQGLVTYRIFMLHISPPPSISSLLIQQGIVCCFLALPSLPFTLAVCSLLPFDSSSLLTMAMLQSQNSAAINLFRKCIVQKSAIWTWYLMYVLHMVAFKAPDSLIRLFNICGSTHMSKNFISSSPILLMRLLMHAKTTPVSCTNKKQLETH